MTVKLGFVVVQMSGKLTKHAFIVIVQPEPHAVLSDSWLLSKVIVLCRLFVVTVRND